MKELVMPPVVFHEGGLSFAEYKGKVADLLKTNGFLGVHPDFLPLTAALALQRHQPWLTKEEILKAMRQDLSKMQVIKEDALRAVDAINKTLALSAK